jgi:hypothetical protein
MAGSGEARHVQADLRHDDAGCQIRDSRHRRQRFSHGRIQFGQRALQRINDLQVQPQHGAVIVCPATIASSIARPLLPSTPDSTLAELEAGVFKHLLEAQRVLRDFPHELLAGSGQILKLLYRLRWHEARADQAVREQVGNPHRIVDVGLVAGNVADVRRVGQDEFELRLQHMPHRLPVPVASMPTWVQSCSASQSANSSNCAVVVPKLRTS